MRDGNEEGEVELCFGFEECDWTVESYFDDLFRGRVFRFFVF